MLTPHELPRQKTPFSTPTGFPGGALVPDLVNQSHQMFASHQGDSLRELASVAVDNPMTTESLVDPSGDHDSAARGAYSTTNVRAQHLESKSLSTA